MNHRGGNVGKVLSLAIDRVLKAGEGGGGAEKRGEAGGGRW